jgi:hypothetical protein
MGTAGLVIAIVALIAALSGAAYAASGGLTAKEKKQVTKIAQKYSGKQGPAGPAGPQGPAGTKGDTGSAGANGTNGTNGTNGISPTGTAFTGEQGTCKEGGVKFVGVNTTYACNGAKGQTGFTQILPSGETETGAWTFGIKDNQLVDLVAASFTIPLDEAPESIHFVNSAGLEKQGADFVTPTNCLGTADEPLAHAGEVCVYAAAEVGSRFIGEAPGAFLKTSGAVWGMALAEGQTSALAAGTWAVTAK